MRSFLIILTCASFFYMCKSDNTTENTGNPTPTESTGAVETGGDTAEPLRQINRTHVPKVSIEEAIRLHEEEGYAWIDLRTPKETAKGKIDDAMEIDVKAYDWLKYVQKLDPNDKLIIYCQAGTRSDLAAKLFSELEFHYVVDMTDGYDGWKKYHNLK